MRPLLAIIDRLLFAFGFALAMQLPQFVDSYTQRYGGYHQALVDGMAEYQRNADEHYGGDLDALIAELHAAPSPGIHGIGDQLENERAREIDMRAGLAILEHGSLPQKLWYLGRHLDRELARATWMAYTPGLPLSADALVCGLIGAIALSSLFNLLRWPFSALRRRRERPLMMPPPAPPPPRPEPREVRKPPAPVERRAPTI
ncbi:DUF2937 family protein [Solimonas terrae]|uniref:DUF2937 family protein n=1 Tax=Solimonas terrae TaxID=1396819 RepID=A0A6M2BQD8_9GAMM|nr:DUF2937 family protein [Solimonas terrae]NGY04510.1 DUF2937 family protein [Solimonas terrae]